jgi:hypothetical protein
MSSSDPSVLRKNQKTYHESYFLQGCKIAMGNSFFYGLHIIKKIGYFEIWKLDTQIDTFIIFV